MFWLLSILILFLNEIVEGSDFSSSQLQGYFTGQLTMGPYFYNAQFQFKVYTDSWTNKVYATIEHQDVESNSVYLRLCNNVDATLICKDPNQSCEINYHEGYLFDIAVVDEKYGDFTYIMTSYINDGEFSFVSNEHQCIGGELLYFSYCICYNEYMSGGYRNCPASPWIYNPAPLKTTPKPTTCKPTTCKPTTCKPTTCKPTTCKPTTCKPTTCKPAITTLYADTTTPQSSTFIPCRKRIVFAFDDSATNIYFKAANNFLVNHIFSNGTWTHLERLGLIWYSNQKDKSVLFDVLNDKKHLGLDYVRQLIRNKPTKSSSTSNVTAALEFLTKTFLPNDVYDEVFYIVFVAQKLDQNTFDSAEPFADALIENGRLTLIGLGDVGKEELYDLSPYSIIWDDPNKDPVFPDWKDFFWVNAYGCGDE